jgi:hypothetical protein
VVGPQGYERETLGKVRDALMARRVGLVGCQKVVHPWLQRELEKRGVVVLSRLSLKHMHAVRRLSGALPLSDVTALAAATAAAVVVEGGAGVAARNEEGGQRAQRQGPVATTMDSLGVLKRPRLRTVGCRTYVVLEAVSDKRLEAFSGKLFLGGGSSCRDSGSSSSNGGGGSTGGGIDGSSQATAIAAAAAAAAAAREFSQRVSSRRAPLATLLLCAPDEEASEECKAVLEGALVALSLALPGTPSGTPAVLAGGGRWEAAALEVLKAKILDFMAGSSADTAYQHPSAEPSKVGDSSHPALFQEKRRRLQTPLGLFVQCFEDAARVRCGSRAWAQATTGALRSPPSPAASGSGVCFSEAPSDSVGPVESFTAAVCALERSVEAANCAMRLRVVASM